MHLPIVSHSPLSCSRAVPSPSAHYPQRLHRPSSLLPPPVQWRILSVHLSVSGSAVLNPLHMCKYAVIALCLFFLANCFSVKLHKKENPKCFHFILILAYALQNYRMIRSLVKQVFIPFAHSFIHLKHWALARCSFYQYVVSFLCLSS